MPTNEEIQEAYGELIAAYDVAISRAIDEMKAREELTTVEVSLLISEVIIGPNAETRAARLKSATTTRRDALNEAIIDKKNADAAVAMCQLEIESYKWQIRNTSNLLKEREMGKEAKKDG